LPCAPCVRNSPCAPRVCNLQCACVAASWSRLTENKLNSCVHDCCFVATGIDLGFFVLPVFLHSQLCVALSISIARANIRILTVLIVEKKLVNVNIPNEYHLSRGSNSIDKIMLPVNTFSMTIKSTFIKQ